MKDALHLAKLFGIAALALAIVSVMVPLIGPVFLVPFALICGFITLYVGNKRLGIATLIIVVINLIISPSFWVLLMNQSGDTSIITLSRLIAWFDFLGILAMSFLIVWRYKRDKQTRKHTQLQDE
ncbi:MAG: hypothetical protein V1652_04170 [bacterium]